MKGCTELRRLTLILYSCRMAPRFYASPFKNAVAQTGKKDAWWSELNVSTSAASDSADLIKTCSEYFVAQGTSGESLSGPSTAARLQLTRTPVGSLVCHGYDSPGKLNHRAPTLQAAARAITDFDVSRFDDLIAAGSDDGKVGTLRDAS